MATVLLYPRHDQAGKRNRDAGPTERLIIIAAFFFLIPAVVLAGPLHDAAKAGEIDRVRQLIAIGTPVASKDEAGNTPLHWAAFNGNKQMIELLLKAGAPVNPMNDLRVTPLLLAAFKSNWDAAQLLAERGADPNARDSDNETPLSIAVDWAKWDLVKHFVSNGADPNLPDKHGSPPLAHVTEGISPEMVKWLVEHGAKVNVRNHSGLSPLHSAAAWGQPETVRYLIEHGADLEAKDRTSHTPLYYAILSGQREIVEDLLDAGADPNAIWGGGPSYPKSALEFAHTFHDKDYGNEVADLLLAHGATIRVAPVPCVSERQVAEINGFGADDRVVKLKGYSARAFMDAILFWEHAEAEQYIDPNRFDTVIAWSLEKLWRNSMAAVVMFKKGCATDDAGGFVPLQNIEAYAEMAKIVTKHADSATRRDKLLSAAERLNKASASVFSESGEKNLVDLVSEFEKRFVDIPPMQQAPPKPSQELWFH